MLCMIHKSLVHYTRKVLIKKSKWTVRYLCFSMIQLLFHIESLSRILGRGCMSSSLTSSTTTYRCKWSGMRFYLNHKHATLGAHLKTCLGSKSDSLLYHEETLPYWKNGRSILVRSCYELHSNFLNMEFGNLELNNDHQRKDL